QRGADVFVERHRLVGARDVVVPVLAKRPDLQVDVDLAGSPCVHHARPGVGCRHDSNPARSSSAQRTLTVGATPAPAALSATGHALSSSAANRAFISVRDAASGSFDHARFTLVFPFRDGLAVASSLPPLAGFQRAVAYFVSRLSAWGSPCSIATLAITRS